MGLTGLDYAAIVGYFALIFGIGISSYVINRRKARRAAENAESAPPTTTSSEDYFLAGRDVSWWACGASLFASNIGSEHFIGLAGSGAASGLAVGFFELLAGFPLILLGWVFVPYYLRSKVYTMPEFLDRRYGPRCRIFLAALSLVAYIFTKISVALFAGGVMFDVILGLDNQYISAAFLVLGTGIYTALGGMTAVVYTEALQTIVLLVGAIALMIKSLIAVGGWEGLSEKLPVDYMHMIKPANDPDFPALGFLLGYPVLTVWYWCTDQVIVQRVLAAKNEDHAKTGSVMAGFLKILPMFLLCIPGMAAHALYPEKIVNDPNIAYPYIAMQILPQGLLGLLVAGMLAALMSSLASVFNSTSTISTIDFYQRWKPHAPQTELVVFGRIVTVVSMILGLLWIPIVPHLSKELFLYLQSVQSYLAPPITAVFLFGIFWRRTTEKAAFSCLCTGTTLGMLRLVLELTFKSEKSNPDASMAFKIIVGSNYMYVGAVIFVICCVVIIAVSLLTEPPLPQQLEGLTYQIPSITAWWNSRNYVNLKDDKLLWRASETTTGDETAKISPLETEDLSVPEAVVPPFFLKKWNPFLAAVLAVAITAIIIILR